MMVHVSRQAEYESTSAAPPHAPGVVPAVDDGFSSACDSFFGTRRYHADSGRGFK